jgi:hypothetical protein
VPRFYYYFIPCPLPPLASQGRKQVPPARSIFVFIPCLLSKLRAKVKTKITGGPLLPPLAPPLACKGSIFCFLTFARASQEARVKKTKMLPLQARGGAKVAFFVFLLPLVLIFMNIFISFARSLLTSKRARDKNNNKNEARAKVIKKQKCYLCKQRGSRGGAKVKNKNATFASKEEAELLFFCI